MNSLIYLPQCSSTQDEIIDFINSNHLEEDFIAVYTFNQTNGRGQYGNIWENYPNENLAYSFAIKTKNIFCSDILFNYYTAIVVRDFIANLTKTEVKIKWPNDLILKNKKICGMLFEKKGDFLICQNSKMFQTMSYFASPPGKKIACFYWRRRQEKPCPPFAGMRQLRQKKLRAPRTVDRPGTPNF